MTRLVRLHVRSRRNKRAKDAEERTFVSEDEEVELLLSSTLEYKTRKTLGVDWESVKSKYQDVVDIYHDNLPTDANDDGEGDPTQARNKPPITREIVTTKLKA